VPISGGVASPTGFSNMPAGSYTVVANYSGDSNFNPTSNFTTLTITPSSNAVTLSCSPTSVVLGSTTTCTAVAPAPDGTVAFYSTADLSGKWWNSPFPAGGGDLGTTPVATTQDGSLNYNVSGESWANTVAGPAGVNSTNIYARWTGTFVSPVDGTYTIGVNSDDGANVYVNGTLLVGNLSTSQSAGADLTYTQSGQIPLTMGATNTIVVEYQQGTGQAGIQLLWTPPGASSATLLGWTVIPVNADGIAQVTGGSPWRAGTYNVTAVYSGDANYASSTSSPAVQVTVTQAAPVLTWPTPAPISYGDPLSSTQLDATSGGIAGTFAYTPTPGTVLPAGTQTLSVTFTPTDLVNYVVQTTTVNLQINKAALVVTPNPASRLYATANPVFTGTITGMIAGDRISATYASGANAITPVGVYSAGANAIAPTLIDPGSKLGNYTVTQNLGALTITQVTTGLTWATPAAITYGTPLSGAQLNATSGGVAGTFVYAPAAGAVLSAGAHPLNVTFTPTDGVGYSTATASVTLTVNPAVLTVTPAPSSKVYGTANPVLTGSIAGMIPGDGISATYSSAATATTVVGVYASGPNAIMATLSDPQSKLGNYTLSQTAGTFTITQATTVLTWATPASISYEAALGSTQLNATSGGVAGTFVYTPAAGTVLSAGSHTLSVAFTPTDAVDYGAATATVTLTVTKTTPTVILTSSANPSVYGGSVTFRATTNAAGTGTVLFYDGGSLLGPGAISGGVATYTLNSFGGGTHSITASYAGDSNYLSAVSAALSQVVTKSPVTITVTSSVNPSNFGQSVTFTFAVTGVAGLATPTGSIAFTDGGTLIVSPVLNPLGVATYTTVTLSGGSHSLAAIYGGDANYQ